MRVIAIMAFRDFLQQVTGRYIAAATTATGLGFCRSLVCRRSWRCETRTRASVLDLTGTTFTPVGVSVTTR